MNDIADGIRIGSYESWMLDQVVEMFVSQYQTDREAEKADFLSFYEHPFQQNRALRFVALDGDIVCGFQSYFYWPYVWQDQTRMTYQSGRSIVSPDYRGRRIFSRLLGQISHSDVHGGLDFVVGFPVEASFGSLIRKGWENPLDLVWHARILNPVASILARHHRTRLLTFEQTPKEMACEHPTGCLSLSKAADFAAWRQSYRSPETQPHYFHHQEKGKLIRFEVKMNRRGRLTELIIGDIARESTDPSLLVSGLRALCRAARKHRFLTAVTIAVNPNCDERQLKPALRKNGFLRIKSGVHFTVKTTDRLSEAHDPQRWWLLRGDIETW